MRTGEMTPYEQAVWQQINLQWADKHHGLIAGLRDGSLVAVPKEPTRAMEDAALDRDAASEETIYHGIYRAMLAAAQEPPR